MVVLLSKLVILSIVVLLSKLVILTRVVLLSKLVILSIVVLLSKLVKLTMVVLLSMLVILSIFCFTVDGRDTDVGRNFGHSRPTSGPFIKRYLLGICINSLRNVYSVYSIISLRGAVACDLYSVIFSA